MPLEPIDTGEIVRHSLRASAPGIRLWTAAVHRAERSRRPLDAASLLGDAVTLGGEQVATVAEDTAREASIWRLGNAYFARAGRDWSGPFRSVPAALKAIGAA